MKKCKRCNILMIETKRKIKPILINMIVDVIVILLLSAISLHYNLNNWLLILVCCFIALNLLLNFIALLVDGFVRYECPKCGKSKQKIKIFRSIFGFIIEIITEFI